MSFLTKEEGLNLCMPSFSPCFVFLINFFTCVFTSAAAAAAVAATVTWPCGKRLSGVVPGLTAGREGNERWRREGKEKRGGRGMESAR